MKAQNMLRPASLHYLKSPKSFAKLNQYKTMRKSTDRGYKSILTSMIAFLSNPEGHSLVPQLHCL